MKQLLYLNVAGSTTQLWMLDRVDDDIGFEQLEFRVQTKEELKKHLLYFRTCMKLELDRRINDCCTSYVTSLVEKKVSLYELMIYSC